MSDTARQVGALVAAVGVVLVAVVVRDRLDQDGGSGAGGGGRVLVCPPELADACERADLGGDVEVRVERALDTAEVLTTARDADGADADLWLVTRPWAQSVDDARERANEPTLLGDPAGPVARSPIGVLVWEDRAAALEAGACGGTIGWRCVGDAADRMWDEVGGEPAWGQVRAGLTDPASATGLTVLGGAVAGYLDRCDYATNDVDGELSSWLGGLSATADRTADEPVPRMLTRGPGELAALGVVEADAVAASATGRDDVRLVVPEPVATADLVVVPVGDGNDGAAADLADDADLRQALTGAGWRAPDGEPAGDPDSYSDVEVPDDTCLPDGAVLRALLDLWLELV